jgi:hypothetical protein
MKSPDQVGVDPERMAPVRVDVVMTASIINQPGQPFSPVVHGLADLSGWRRRQRR